MTIPCEMHANQQNREQLDVAVEASGHSIVSHEAIPKEETLLLFRSFVALWLFYALNQALPHPLALLATSPRGG